MERAVDRGSVEPATAEAIAKLCDALDETVGDVPCPEGEPHRSVKTLDMYTRRLRLIAQRYSGDILDTTAAELNTEMRTWLNGTHPDVDDDGLSVNTVSNYQSPLRIFFRYHDHLGVTPEDIEIETPSAATLDPGEMLTDSEIRRVRDAVTNPLERVVFEFLLHTGMRNTATRMLTVGGVDLRSGTFELNVDSDGLKGAQERGETRPLLGAEPIVREWLTVHPAADDPDAYLFTNRPGSGYATPDKPLSHTKLGKLLSGLRDRAGIAKPLHPHALRHNFVTRAKRDHRVEDDVIKYLIGHRRDSTVMERTYQHISPKEYLTTASGGSAGQRGFTPKECFECGAGLCPRQELCPDCGTVYSPGGGAWFRSAADENRSALVAFARQLLDDELLESVPPSIRSELAEKL
ncbi:tyrosine-type recombinase/integrase [Haloarchaeobius iranensis]|uniref:Site-specific recombinase XerD n=1 Tax=Haloarchaeobius iranensis TaxID=996166 RepID=A0A1G9YXH7_9EURY|nr:tyrosine-type recombinase/integrase [Haloarchaeobius iranensis]SDN13261.1 Site-specific recombinase XerD [Haloarchaeobius iranensis]